MNNRRKRGQVYTLHKLTEKENSFYALGHTDTDRLLFMVFTIRKSKVRVISARDMNRKEAEKIEEELNAVRA